MSEKTPRFEDFDDVLAENNRQIVAAGGPRFSTKEEDAETAREIAKIKADNRKKLNADRMKTSGNQFKQSTRSEKKHES